MMPLASQPMIPRASRIRKTRLAVVRDGRACQTAFATLSKRATRSTTEEHVQIGRGTASSVQDGALLRVSSDYIHDVTVGANPHLQTQILLSL